MADQENIKPLTEQHQRDAQSEASMALGKAWGLAETLNFHTGERPGEFNIEGVMRVVCSLVKQAREKMDEGSIQWQEIGAALAVCDLVLIDSHETGNATWNEIASPSGWALLAVPSAIQRAKNVVDAAPWGLPKLKAA